MRYFLIDRVLEIVENRRVVTVKCVALAEDIYADHFYGNPVMPGAMQIEAMAQSATVLLELSSQLTRKAVLAMVNNVKFRKVVRPGDQLVIEMTQASTDETVVQLDGTITSAGDIVTKGRLTFSLQPIDNFYPPSLRSMTKLMYQNFLRGAKCEGLKWLKELDD